MSTHNIGFYEEMTKIIFQLSSNAHLISSSVGKLTKLLKPPLGKVHSFTYVPSQKRTLAKSFPCVHEESFGA